MRGRGLSRLGLAVAILCGGCRHRGPPPPAPTLAPLDQSTTRALVTGTHAGAVVSIWDSHGTQVGAVVSHGTRTRVDLWRPLVPGEELAAAQFAYGHPGPLSNPRRVELNHVTYHFDRYRTGWNPYESRLSVAAVSAHLSLLATLPVDGAVRAQPLYVQNVAIGGHHHDVLLVATENDSLYAFDARTSQSTTTPLWPVRRLVSGTEAPADPANVGNCNSQLGVSATPVVDRTTNTVYVSALLQRTPGSSAPLLFRVHAIDLSTGQDQPGSPVEITNATVGFVNDAGAPVTFDPKWLGNRPGLLLSRGVLYLAFGSHCFDQDDYHGWVIALDADLPGTPTFLHQLGTLNTTPDLAPPGPGFHDRAGIWMSGFAPAADEDGNVYLVTGNGPYLANQDYGNSVLKLAPPPFSGGRIRVADSFTPFDWQSWNGGLDADLGSGGAMLVPVPRPGAPTPSGPAHKLIVAGKPGKAYVIDRDAMSKNVAPPGPDSVLQTVEFVPGSMPNVAGGPAYYEGPSGPRVFFGLGLEKLQTFLLQNDRLVTQTKSQLPAPYTSPIPVVSSSGKLPGTGVVWVVFHPAATSNTLLLQAFDAENLAGPPLLAGGGLAAGTWPSYAAHSGGNSFVVPTVVHGRVYTTANGEVRIWGLHPGHVHHPPSP